MDGLLRRELHAIARDRRSGAAELAQRAVRALQTWLRRRRRPSEPELLEIARTLLRAQPSIAPLFRLANEVAVATDAAHPGTFLAHSARTFAHLLRLAPKRIARHFASWLHKVRGLEVYTTSYSSTVIRALLSARKSIHSVCCSESRPGREGLSTARRLAAGGIKVWVPTDLVQLSQLHARCLVVVGADALLEGCVAVKAGTRGLLRCARSVGARAVFLADTTKFWPQPSSHYPHWEWTSGPDDELWQRPPKGVQIYNLYFELVALPANSRLRLLTERGWMTPKQVRRELKKVRISPRLAALAD